MTIRVEPFAGEHLDGFEPAPGQHLDLLTPDRIALLEQCWSFTAFSEAGTPLMCAGALPDDSGTWHGWSMFSIHAAPRMVALTRAVLFFLRRAPASTLRIAVEHRHRWVRMLGFDPLGQTQIIAGK